MYKVSSINSKGKKFASGLSLANLTIVSSSVVL